MAGCYRYGYNGKELDTEGMGGGGATYDYGFRIYNPQIGKFLSVDPLMAYFPMLTPYQYASNTPIKSIDLDGLESLDYREGDEFVWRSAGIGKVQLITPDTYGLEKNTPEWKQYVAAFYQFHLHNASAGETLDLLSEKYGVSKNQIKQFNPGIDNNLANGQCIVIPPTPEDIETLLNDKDVTNYYTNLHRMKFIKANMSHVLEKMIANNSALLQIEERKRYIIQAASADVGLSLTPGIGQVKSIIEIYIGKNVTYYVAFEVLKGEKVDEFSNLDYFQNTLDVLLPGVKALSTAGKLIKLENSTIQLIEVSGNVNSVINVSRGANSTIEEKKSK
ncbi:RHS repeat-associated core domain-containing protein [Cytophagaceae bacterium ABcell3]|nr:RHS repeat-associated core domain-containing protein [Cytophagaceae bacterium ABcell3]